MHHSHSNLKNLLSKREEYETRMTEMERVVRLRNEFDDSIGLAEVAYSKIYESIINLNFTIAHEMDRLQGDGKLM